MFITVSNSVLLTSIFLLLGYKIYIKIADCIHLRKELKLYGDFETISFQLPKIKYRLRKARNKAIIYFAVTVIFTAVIYYINFL